MLLNSLKKIAKNFAVTGKVIVVGVMWVVGLVWGSRVLVAAEGGKAAGGETKTEWRLEDGNLRETLRELDFVIGNKRQYEGEYAAGIAKARSDYENADSLSDRYNTLRSLYELYRSFRIDSALIVAEQRLEVAGKMDIPSKVASASLNLAEGYARSGNPDKALAILDSLDVSVLEDYHKKYRNSIYRSALTMKAQTALLGSDRMSAIERLRSFQDSDFSQSPVNSRGYLTLKAEKLRDAGLYKEAVAEIEKAHRQFDFSNDAAMLYTMGEIYIDAGDVQKGAECLARSAILDISSGKKEYKSLILLSSLLFEQGDVERAFDYINCAFDDAAFSHANMRTAEIMKSMPLIDKAFHQQEREIAKRTRWFLIGSGILIALLLIFIVLLVRLNRERRKMMTEIEGANRRLEEQNAALKEADRLKLQHIKSLMMAYSTYISRLRNYRKGIYRLLKTGQNEKALDAVKSNSADAGDVAAFQEMFDEAFLSIYPDFIAKLNQYLAEPVEIREGKRLSPELRVAALISLGITTTEEISDMLHYSAQTVYNLRSTLKGMLKVDMKEFEQGIGI